MSCFSGPLAIGICSAGVVLGIGIGILVTIMLVGAGVLVMDFLEHRGWL